MKDDYIKETHLRLYTMSFPGLSGLLQGGCVRRLGRADSIKGKGVVGECIVPAQRSLAQVRPLCEQQVESCSADPKQPPFQGKNIRMGQGEGFS